MIRIGISALYQLHGGSLVSMREYLPRWSAEAQAEDIQLVLYTRPENLPLLDGTLDRNVEIRLTPTWRRWATVRRLLWEQIRLPAALRQDRIDVLFCSGNIVPWQNRVPSVVVFHNAAPFCEGLSPATIGLRGWLRFRAMRVLMLAAARRAARVVFLSHYLRGILETRHGFPRERGVVIYNGRDDGPPPASDGQGDLPRPYLAFVSHLYRYKAVEPLLKGFARVANQSAVRGVTLVIVGSAPDATYRAELESVAGTLGIRDRVMFTGAMPHDQTRRVVQGAEAFVFQSLCENCPNALIEALALGVPVASSRASVMPEIAGDAAEYFDPTDDDSIGDAIARVLGDRHSREVLRQRAFARAAQFPDWAEVARLTLLAVKGVVPSRARFDHVPTA